MDLLVVIFYLALVFIVAFLSKRKTLTQTETEEEIISSQYLANRSLSFVESMGSIIATEVSALTFLGIPAFAFSKDFSFLQIYIGAIFGRLIIARFFLPQIYGKGLTIYSIMASKGSTPLGHKLTTLIYSISKILAVGVRLYSGSILVAAFFGISIYFAVIIISVLTYCYTLIGGLKAVVRADLLQAGLFIIGGITAHILIPKIGNSSWSELWSIAYQANKISLLDFSNPYPFFVGVIGGFLFDMATHGVDQDFTQRLMACHSIKRAKQAIFFSSFLSIMVGSLFLGVGALLWAYYQKMPLPPGVKPDHLFAHFITNYFPSPLKGLMLAGVLAATMSTLDSTINALSSCLWNDLLPNRNIKKIRRHITIDTLIIGLLLLLVALLASTSDQLLLLGLKVASWSGGSLLSLFCSQLIWKKWIQTPLNGLSVSGNYIVNIIGVLINTFIIKGAWQWNVYWGFICGTLFLFFYGKNGRIFSD